MKQIFVIIAQLFAQLSEQFSALSALTMGDTPIDPGPSPVPPEVDPTPEPEPPVLPLPPTDETDLPDHIKIYEIGYEGNLTAETTKWLTDDPMSIEHQCMYSMWKGNKGIERDTSKGGKVPHGAIIWDNPIDGTERFSGEPYASLTLDLTHEAGKNIFRAQIGFPQGKLKKAVDGFESGRWVQYTKERPHTEDFYPRRAGANKVRIHAMSFRFPLVEPGTTNEPRKYPDLLGPGTLDAPAFLQVAQVKDMLNGALVPFQLGHRGDHMIVKLQQDERTRAGWRIADVTPDKWIDVIMVTKSATNKTSGDGFCEIWVDDRVEQDGVPVLKRVYSFEGNFFDYEDPRFEDGHPTDFFMGKLDWGCYPADFRIRQRHHKWIEAGFSELVFHYSSVKTTDVSIEDYQDYGASIRKRLFEV